MNGEEREDRKLELISSMLITMPHNHDVIDHIVCRGTVVLCVNKSYLHK